MIMYMCVFCTLNVSLANLSLTLLARHGSRILTSVWRRHNMKHSSFFRGTESTGYRYIPLTQRQQCGSLVFFMMTSWNGNIFRVTGLLWVQSTGYRWISLTKVSDAELWCFLWSAPEYTVEQTMKKLVIWDAGALIMTSLYMFLCVLACSRIQSSCHMWISRYVTVMQYSLHHKSVHDDVIKFKHVPGYRPFVWGIHRSPMNSPHKGQWRGALMFSLICVWINGWVKNRKAGDLRHHHAHYDATVMLLWNVCSRKHDKIIFARWSILSKYCLRASFLNNLLIQPNEFWPSYFL